MKRKFSLFVTIVVCLLIAAGILSACNDPGEETPGAHVHSMELTVAKEATCTEAGNNAYYHCSGCNKYFKDEAGAQETTVEAEVISATGHNWDNGEITTAATCTTDGVMTYTCLDCAETKIETIPALGHSMTLTEANAATCTEAGNNDYYHCSGCNKYFKDEAGAQETTVEAEVISATGHNWDNGEITTAATCTTDGVMTYTCLNCGETKTETIPATGHNWNDGEVTTAATCTTDGVMTYTCLDCAETKIETIPALGHGMTIIKAKDATCTEAGNNAYYHCTRCNKYFKDIEGEEETTVEAETISATGHNYINGECVKCGATEPYTRVDGGGNESQTGDYILFGSYPQSKVTDASTISALGGFDKSAWTSYRYYRDGNVSNYMYYIDKEYNGEKYRGVYFTSYRPDHCDSVYGFCQDDNGYASSTVYWFKYEPIKWLIVEESDGKATLVADLILDSQQYDYEANKETYGNNNYAESTIRAWLNETFYNTAFNELQQAIIQTVEVDNSAESTGYNPNQYACENTSDKIFLMSYVEADTWFTSEFAREKQGSDYAKSQGLGVLVISSHLGNSYYWLRSPYNYYSNRARYVSYDGGIGSHSHESVDYTYYGVLPALVIEL